MARRGYNGFNELNRTLRFLSIRLGPYVDAKAIQEQADQMRSRLLLTNESWQQAVEVRVAATAELDYLDKTLDILVANLARDLMVMVGGNRDEARYRRLMPVAPSVAMAGVGGDFQSRYVKTVLAVLNDDADFVSLEPYAAPIAMAQAKLEQAFATRAELGIPESRAHTDRQLALDEARRFLGLARAHLTLLFPDDKNLVSSFFLKKGSTKSSAVLEEVSVETEMDSDDDEMS